MKNLVHLTLLFFADFLLAVFNTAYINDQKAEQKKDQSHTLILIY